MTHFFCVALLEIFQISCLSSVSCILSLSHLDKPHPSLTWTESSLFTLLKSWFGHMYLDHITRTLLHFLPAPQTSTGKVYKPLAICTLLLVAIGGALVTVSGPCPTHCSHLTQYIPVGVSQWQWCIPPVILLMYNHSVLSAHSYLYFNRLRKQ